MNIKKYTSYFHDGDVIDIQHQDDTIVFSLASAEVDPDELYDPIPLSCDNRIKGKLHLEGIKHIKIDGNFLLNHLKMVQESGELCHLKINEHSVLLEIYWEVFTPKHKKTDYNVLEIEAEKIYWESIPDLIDPFGS